MLRRSRGEESAAAVLGSMGEPAIAGRFVVSGALAQRSNQVRQLTFVPHPAIPRNEAKLLRPCEDLPKAAAIAGFVRETHRSLDRHAGGLQRALIAVWLDPRFKDPQLLQAELFAICVLCSTAILHAKKVSTSVAAREPPSYAVAARTSTHCTTTTSTAAESLLHSQQSKCYDERQSSSTPPRSQEP